MIIKTENLSYIYSKGTPFEKKAVDNVSIEIKKDDFIGIIGHTGSGKSTLIKHFNGLLKPTQGKIYIDGKDIWSNKAYLRQARFKVGLVFQYPEYQLFEETVYKDVAFGPSNMGLSADEIDFRVHEALKFVGLKEDILSKSPFELSGGQKRRTAIAGVIAMDPEALVLDEPTAGLDPRGRSEILEHIREYHAEHKKAVIIISHSMDDIARNVNKVLVMNQASVAFFDTVNEIFKKADELSAIGLSVPQITKIFHELDNRGFKLDTSVFTAQRAREEIIRYIGEQGV